MKEEITFLVQDSVLELGLPIHMDTKYSRFYIIKYSCGELDCTSINGSYKRIKTTYIFNAGGVGEVVFGKDLDIAIVS